MTLSPPSSSGNSHRIECDCCQEVWEKSFFCKACSERMADDDLRERTWVHELNDNGSCEPEYFVKSVCGNCCTCHLRADCDERGTAKGVTAGETARDL